MRSERLKLSLVIKQLRTCQADIQNSSRTFLPDSTRYRVGAVSWTPWAPGCLTNLPHCGGVFTFPEERGLCYLQLPKGSSRLTGLDAPGILILAFTATGRATTTGLRNRKISPIRIQEVSLQGKCPHFPHLLTKIAER